MTERMTMSPTSNTEHLTARTRLPVSWWTVGLFALLLTAADGFWATSLRGAVGYIEATQAPFPDWIRYLAVMLPVYGVAVFGALWVAQRLVGGRRGLVRILVAALLTVTLTTVIAVGQIALTATYDYHTQANQLALMAHLHGQSGVTYRVDPGTATPAATSGCTGLCSSKQQTLAVHVRAITLISIVLLVTNAMLVLWALALRGGRLWVRRRSGRPTPAGAIEVDQAAAVVI
jgi:hypothetical protein